MNFLSQKKKRTFLVERKKQLAVKSDFDDFYYKEVAKLTGAGGWSVNLRDKESFLDPQAQHILNTPPNFKPTPKASIEFYADEEKERVRGIFFACTLGKPFSTTIKMLTYDGKEFWAKASGEPVYDKNETLIGIRGVFEDINAEKLQELSLQKSLKVIASQNSRLFNFAHIVSHTLRSHSSNLQLTVQLLNSINSESEEKELKDNLIDISSSLNGAISHLNEIVKVQSKAHQEKRDVVFEEVLQNVKNSINCLIIDTETEIYSDFSEVTSITYIPAYMENILMNLLTNSIKYRHIERTPVIDVFTFKEDNRNCLVVKDNGLGIDLEKNNDKVFNMYQTFHENEGAVGIGLFMTKNQVETLQGNISIESTVDKGTAIKIKF